MSNSSITIYSPSGEQLYAMPAIFENCTEKFTLMQEDYIELHFNLLKPIFFEIGCWCLWNGKKYYVTEFQQPSYDANTGGYGYELKLNAYYRAWGLKLYKYSSLAFSGSESSVALRELTFSLTANLLTHAQTLVRCLNLDGFRWYNADSDKDEEFTAKLWTSKNDEEVDFNEVKTISYDGVTYLDALSQIADEWSTEWWVKDDVLYFGKCQDNTTEAVDFEQGVNVETIDGSKCQTDYATRVYAFGADKNLPTYYGKGDAVFDIKQSPQVKDERVYFELSKPLYSYYFDEKYKQQTNAKKFSFDIDTLAGSPIGLKQDSAWASGNIESSEVKLPSGIYNLTSTAEDIAYRITAKCTLSFVSPLSAEAGETLKGTAYVVLIGDGGKTISLGTMGGKELKVKNVIAYTESGYTASFTIMQGSHSYSHQFSVVLPSFTLSKETDVKLQVYLATQGKEGGNIVCAAQITKDITIVEKYKYTCYNLVLTPKTGIYKGQKLNATWKKQDVSLSDEERKKDPNLYGVIMPESYKDGLVGQTIRIDNIRLYKLPSWYFEGEMDAQNASTIKAFSEKRLTLPSPYYVDAEKNVPFGSRIEKVLTYDDIYPRTETYITDVKTKSEYVSDENNEQTTLQYTDYYIKQDTFDFDNDYKLESAENLQIKFVTGALAGLTFDTEYCQDTYPDISYKGYFKIFRQQMDGGMWLPNDAMHPALADPTNENDEADKFVLIGWDSSRIEDLGLVKAAQDELLEKVKKEIVKMNEDPTTYDCTMMSDVMYGRAEETLITDDNGVPITDDRGVQIRTDDSAHGLDASKGVTYQIGQRVRLISGALFKGGERMSRIIGYEKKMDIPWDSPVYQVGEKAIYSTIGNIKNEIKQLKRK